MGKAARRIVIERQPRHLASAEGIEVIEHMVWFRFRAEVPASHREELVERLLALRDLVPNILELWVGDDFSGRSQGHQLGLLVRVRDRAALDAYQVHPEHVAVAKLLRESCDSIMALDFEHA